MFGWLKAKAQKKFTDSMRDDLERFILSVKGSSSFERATLLLFSAPIRLKFLESGMIPEAALDLSLYAPTIENDSAALKVNRVIREFQKNQQMADAAGAMIWLHSIRALQNPELRLLGRDLWSELQKGFPHLDEAASELSQILPDFDWSLVESAKFVPVGLEAELE